MARAVKVVCVVIVFRDLCDLIAGAINIGISLTLSKFISSESSPTRKSRTCVTRIQQARHCEKLLKSIDNFWSVMEIDHVRRVAGYIAQAREIGQSLKLADET